MPSQSFDCRRCRPLTLCALVLLASCGQKGDLYLAKSDTWTRSAPASATASAPDSDAPDPDAAAPADTGADKPASVSRH